MWYDEKKDYDFRKAVFGGNTGKCSLTHTIVSPLADQPTDTQTARPTQGFIITLYTAILPRPILAGRNHTHPVLERPYTSEVGNLSSVAS